MPVAPAKVASVARVSRPLVTEGRQRALGCWLALRPVSLQTGRETALRCQRWLVFRWPHLECGPDIAEHLQICLFLLEESGDPLIRPLCLAGADG